METDSWLGIELRHLAALRAVVTEGSFGRAAASLGYTQSAVSQQIATLERVVGQRLIDRPGGSRAVSPTEAGRVLLRHADGIVARLHAAQADLDALAAGAAGCLRVGTYQSVGARILPEVLRRFADAYPDVDVQLTEGEDDELLNGVETGELDLAFAMLPMPEGPFQAQELMTDPYVLVVQAGSLLALRDRAPTLREVSALPLVGFRTCRSVHQVEQHFHSHGLEPHVVFRSDSNGTIQGMVAAGVGAALLPILAVDANDSRIATVDLGSKVPPRVIAIAWHRDRHQAVSARAFVQLAEAVCSEIEQASGSHAVA